MPQWCNGYTISAAGEGRMSSKNFGWKNGAKCWPTVGKLYGIDLKAFIQTCRPMTYFLHREIKKFKCKNITNISAYKDGNTV